MSRKTDESGYGSAENYGEPDETPQEERTAAAEVAAQATAQASADEAAAQAAVQATAPAFLAIEEHAKAQQIPAPVFAAVRQMKGWSEGKKVEAAEFNDAVSAFLGAPMGGKE